MGAFLQKLKAGPGWMIVADYCWLLPYIFHEKQLDDLPTGWTQVVPVHDI